MFPILRSLGSFSSLVKGVAAAALFAVSAIAASPAAKDSADYADVPVLDSLAKTLDSLNLTSRGSVVDPAVQNKTAPLSASDTKSVLYLGGGERSPWYYLGVLYAIEEYGIPVDSIVGTSWGAWVGSLWSRGIAVDEIQRLMLDPAIVSYVGRDLTLEKMHSKTGSEIAVSPKGIPSLRQRFTLQVDSLGHTARNLLPLEMDSAYVERSLARLRFQELLYRQRGKQMIPFAVQGCGGVSRGNSVESVINSLPLWNESRESPEISGEICPHYAIPLEDRANELSLIAVAEPLRNEYKGEERKGILLDQAASTLATQPGVIIRAHMVQDTSRKAWIQAGFSAVERKIPEMDRLASRKVDYSKRHNAPALPWFRFTPSFDGMSAEVLTAVQSHWTESDTGFTAPVHYALSIAKNPAYDSLRFSMQPNGELLVGTAVHPTYDLAAGVFGSNAIGANGYVEATVHYIDQMEILLSLKGFWGSSSYGIMPRLEFSRLWSRHWSVLIGYDYVKLSPLKSFNNDIDSTLQIQSEKRNDFVLSLMYNLNPEQTLSLDFLFGQRTFELHRFYGRKAINTYPVSPAVHYSFKKGEDDKWFSTGGMSLDASIGMESIGFDFGVNAVIPIYWKIVLASRYTVSPRPFATFTVGASGGIERYHEEGYGYVVPESFDYAPLDIAYRLHGEVTPWTSQWYNPELASHEYATLRASAAIHGKQMGLWLFGAYFHDFEENPYATLRPNKFILEPAFRFNYKSISVYAGMNRVVDQNNFGDLKKFKDYTYFIRVGDYEF